jgi:hypothetical protein
MHSWRAQGELYLYLVMVVVVLVLVVSAPNVFEPAVPLFRTRQVPRSTLGKRTGSMTWLSIIFSTPSWQMPQQRLKLGLDRFLPHPFQFITHSSSYH